jgi:hypothetical protein
LTGLRAVVTDFFFKCIWRFLQMTVFGTFQGASTVMHNAFERKRSRISMLEVETIPQSCIP